MLSNVDIKAAIEAGDISVTPYREELLQPASLEVLLGRGSLLADPVPYHRAWLEDLRLTPTAKEMRLNPQELMLVSTHEVITLGPNIAARFEGKSSLGRLGIMTHVTAGFIDPGFSGQITLELYNVSPWPHDLPIGMKIGQLSFFRLDTPTDKLYGTAAAGSHYQGQRGPTPSRITEGFKVYDISGDNRE